MVSHYFLKKIIYFLIIDWYFVTDISLENIDNGDFEKKKKNWNYFFIHSFFLDNNQYSSSLDALRHNNLPSSSTLSCNSITF